MSNKAFAWLAGTLIICVAVLAVLIANMKALSAALPWLGSMIGILLLLGAAYLGYQVWHKVRTQHLERKALFATSHIALKQQDHHEWLEAQTLLHQQEIEHERLRLEEMKAANEHTRLLIAARQIIMPAGHTALISDDAVYQAVLGQPIQPKQITTVVTEEQIAAMYPRPRDFAAVLTEFRPSADAIYLMDTVDQPVLVEMKNVCHVGLGGPTGGGKTNTTRLLAAQLLACGAPMYMANPNYNPVKLNKDHIEDWRPIVRHLAAPVAREIDDIMSLLNRFLAAFEQRKKQADHSIRRGVDMFLILCELPAIIAQNRDAADIIGRLLREARQYGIHVISEFQDALVSTIGGSSGARENYRTGYYFGGDLKTAQILLDLAKGERVVEEGIGQKGAVYLRCESVKARPGRVPFFSNRALYMLLGTPPDPMTDDKIYSEDQVPESFYALKPDGRYLDVASGQEITVIEGTVETRHDGRETPDKLPAYTPMTTRQTGPLSALVETTEVTSSGRFARMTDIQAVQFEAAYKIRQNIDFCLRSISLGTMYRDHAREIIRTRGLKREEK